MTYNIVFAVWYILSLLPLCVHYVFSDVLYFFLYRVAGYRIKVVRHNLATSFPDKDEKELQNIERRFYHWFCDYIVETVKMFSMSERQMRKRMRFEDLEQVEQELRNGRSVTIYLGHYCNWEWVSSLPLSLSAEATAAQLYHPIENKAMDRLFLYSRSRFGAVSLEMKEAFGILRNWEKEGRRSVTGYISDQVPGYSSMHYWPWFLNHDTPAYTGAERIAHVLNTPVFYLDIYRPRRGYYVAKVVKMSGEPQKEEKFAMTEKYYRLLEDSIKRAPEFWLWSHNRWKRTREEFNALYPEEERKRILSKL
jgi:KDO2-lipid IV(A) lauroyltransferase